MIHLIHLITTRAPCHLAIPLPLPVVTWAVVTALSSVVPNKLPAQVPSHQPSFRYSASPTTTSHTILAREFDDGPLSETSKVQQYVTTLCFLQGCFESSSAISFELDRNKTTLARSLVLSYRDPPQR